MLEHGRTTAIDYRRPFLWRINQIRLGRGRIVDQVRKVIRPHRLLLLVTEFACISAGGTLLQGHAVVDLINPAPTLLQEDSPINYFLFFFLSLSLSFCLLDIN